jgi:hypothetical protein
VISVFFNSEGYYIEGDGVEVARSFSVLACALKELRGCKQKAGADIYVFNDSRLIEDMSNTVSVEDCVCQEMKSVIRRKLLPDLPGMVLFRKKPAAVVREKIEHGKTTMLAGADRKHLMQMVETLAQSIEENAQARKADKVASLKRAWFGEQSND